MADHQNTSLPDDLSAASGLLPGGLIALEEWTLPELPVHRSLRDGLRSAWQQLRAQVTPEQEPFKSLDDLPELSADQLVTLAPEPDYTTLSRLMCVWAEQSQGGSEPTRLIVAPPFSGVRQALAQSERRLLTPPSDLLMSAGSARQWWQEQNLDEPWVIADLGTFWRRHRLGMELVRHFFGLLAEGRTGEGIVGCNSWSWAFWKRYLTYVPAGILTPAPMTGERLGQWLETMLAQDGHPLPDIRMSDSGAPVLSGGATAADVPEQPASTMPSSAFLRDLAAISRGIPGVALSIWKQALRAGPEQEAREDDDSGPAQSCQGWLVPLSKLSLPMAVAGQGRASGLLLHALLMHASLSSPALASVTGLDATTVSVTLARLRRADLVTATDDEADLAGWSVSALAYPAVRRQLETEGYCVDDF